MIISHKNLFAYKNALKIFAKKIFYIYNDNINGGKNGLY